MLYGYLCRAVGLYFFWESKYIGWSLIFLGMIGFLINRIKIKKVQRRKTLLEKIGIGILIIVLLAQCILVSVVPYTDAYKASREFLLNDQRLKNEIGNIRNISLIPLGSIQKNTTGGIETGNATLLLIIKGEKKFKDVTVYVEKAPGKDWAVIGTE